MEGHNVSLNGEWKIRRATRVDADGKELSRPGFAVDGWIPAQVPGTVLGAMIDAGVYPDPWDRAATAEPPPDLAEGNAGTYTFWWLRDFELAPPSTGERYWLDFHGINHRADVYVNGKRVGETLSGMFRRHSLDVTSVCRRGANRVALRIMPPAAPAVGGGEGTEGEGGGARMGYAGGRDWIPPVADRNTGPWAGVELRVTGPIRINDLRVVTYVVGADGEAADKATLMLGAEVHNVGDEEDLATLTAHLVDTGQVVERELRLPPGERTQAALEDLDIMYPHLWWPRGTDGAGPPSLYTVELLLNVEGVLSDRATVRFGVREVATRVDDETGGRVLSVNGRDVFVHAADWTGTDALLRRRYLSPQRYRDEVRLHAELGVNLLRVRGDGIVERPEFYAACDELGVMVIQDFPRSREGIDEAPGGGGEAFLDCARDSIKLLRNHPSLVLWSGGDDVAGVDVSSKGDDRVDHCLRCHVTGRDEDGERCRFSGSEACGSEGVLDGTRPYLRSSTEAFQGVVEVAVGSGAGPVAGDAEGDAGDGGGAASVVAAREAVGETRARMWDPHTGLHLGRVQGPWPGMEGTLYDWNLRQSASYFGARRALRPVALLLTGGADADGDDAGGAGDDRTSVRLVNGGARPVAGTLTATAHDLRGRELARYEAGLSADASSASAAIPLDWPDAAPVGPHFLTLELRPAPVSGEDEDGGEGGEGGGDTAPLAHSRYWRSGPGRAADADLSPLDDLPWVELEVSATVEKAGEEYAVRARLRNPAETPAIAVELHLLPGGADDSGEAVSPAFYSDNFFTLLPAEEREVVVRCSVEAAGGAEPVLEIGGWNVDGANGFQPGSGAA